MPDVFERLPYQKLNGRQQEAYNFQKVSGVLADYGFVTLTMSVLVVSGVTQSYFSYRESTSVLGELQREKGGQWQGRIDPARGIRHEARGKGNRRELRGRDSNPDTQLQRLLSCR